MKQGTLVYDYETERMNIRFGLEDYYGGLFEWKVDPYKN